MGLGVRLKLVLLSVAVMIVMSFGFAALSLSLTPRLGRGGPARARHRLRPRDRGDHRRPARAREPALLHEQIREILGIRRNVGQLDILAFDGEGARIVATSHPDRRLPFTRENVARVQQGQVVSRLIAGPEERYWEVMAPITLAGVPAGAVAARFSLERADQAAARTRVWAFALTAASVVVMALLMSFAIRQVVDRPVRRFVDAIARIRTGDTSATVPVAGRDEFGVMARHFNEMMARINQFSDELQRRVKEAVAELDQRYHEVQRLNEQLLRDAAAAESRRAAGGLRTHHGGGGARGGDAAALGGRASRAAPKAAPARGAHGRHAPPARRHREPARARHRDHHPAPRRDPPLGGPARAVDVAHLLRETIELVRPGMSAAGLVLRVDAAPEVPPVTGTRASSSR